MLNDYARLDRRVSEERLNCKIYALTCDLVFGPSPRAWDDLGMDNHNQFKWLLGAGLGRLVPFAVGLLARVFAP